jgi:hypothetical protein
MEEEDHPACLMFRQVISLRSASHAHAEELHPWVSDITNVIAQEVVNHVPDAEGRATMQEAHERMVRLAQIVYRQIYDLRQAVDDFEDHTVEVLRSHAVDHHRGLHLPPPTQKDPKRPRTE